MQYLACTLTIKNKEQRLNGSVFVEILYTVKAGKKAVLSNYDTDWCNCALPKAV